MMTGEKYINVDGIKTRYFEKGSGPAVVLFHGGNFGSHDAADCAEDWSLNFDGLAEWFHVFALDKIGQGFTDNPQRDEDYTMAAVVQHAYGFLKTLKLRNVHPVGHSRGAYLVARLTLEHPELFKTCILVDTNTLAPGISKNETVMANPPRPRLSRESQCWVLQKYSFGFEHITDEWLDAMMRVVALPKYQDAVRKMEEAGLRINLFLPHLARQKDETLGLVRDRGMGRPTLLAWGYHDPTATIDQGYALFDLISRNTHDSRMYVLNRAGHFSYREHPAEFNEMLRSFIQRNA
ncbi:MAG TPA: alpha/beta hydrolase [Candidatus Binatia bacterium]|nr:alpha/beta hydrolase [Candidatus Binatia bacterium]